MPKESTAKPVEAADEVGEEAIDINVAKVKKLIADLESAKENPSEDNILGKIQDLCDNASEEQLPMYYKVLTAAYLKDSIYKKDYLSIRRKILARLGIKALDIIEKLFNQDADLAREDLKVLAEVWSGQLNEDKYFGEEKTRVEKAVKRAREMMDRTGN